MAPLRSGPSVPRGAPLAGAQQRPIGTTPAQIQVCRHFGSFMNIKTRTTLIVAILALCSSCSMFRSQWPPAVDPLQGWNDWSEDGGYPHSPIAKAITEDCRNYLEKHVRHYIDVGTPSFHEDGTGQHAVIVLIRNRDRELFYYYFIYDKSNTRTKVMRFFYLRDAAC